MSDGTFVLASGSPRRRELLEQLGLRFEVRAVDVDESVSAGEAPLDYVQRVTADKRDAASEATAAWFVVADTVVHLGETLYGKPSDDAQATAMIERLSGQTHEVTTAFVVARRGALSAPRCVTTRVRFRALQADEIARYVATGEGRDKAGAYAVQGIGAGLVESIEGSYWNVVGLPLERVLPELRKNGVVAQWP